MPLSESDSASSCRCRFETRRFRSVLFLDVRGPSRFLSLHWPYPYPRTRCSGRWRRRWCFSCARGVCASQFVCHMGTGCCPLKIPQYERFPSNRTRRSSGEPLAACHSLFGERLQNSCWPSGLPSYQVFGVADDIKQQVDLHCHSHSLPSLLCPSSPLARRTTRSQIKTVRLLDFAQTNCRGRHISQQQI